MKLVDLVIDSARLDARVGAIEIGGITADSRAVKRGDLFVAMAGSKTDGLRFVEPAVKAGAAAVMAERAPDAPIQGAVVVKVENARRALALAAARLDRKSTRLNSSHT